MANFLVNIIKQKGILQNPGDHLEARITDGNRKVIKAQVGDKKFSATQYPNGRIVETRLYFLEDK